MAKLMYIQASPRLQRSHCKAIADAFIKAYGRKNPKDEIKTIDIFTADLPEFDGPAVQAKYKILHGKIPSKDNKIWRQVEDVIADFKSADKYVLAVPMWNFSIPYKLKLYIDILVQPGYTFSYSPDTGYEGLVKDKPLLVVYARGGSYESGTAAAQFDLQKKYIETIFGFVGFTDIRTIIIEPTLQAESDLLKQRQMRAIEKAEKMAEIF
ncbi:MAG: NAD(P)H-dependent oxidoreductase [Phycisphaerae bacterium]|nr:NAD(P)H-dependent oxidoreductase [Phycisphaerae bacterium]